MAKDVARARSLYVVPTHSSVVERYGVCGHEWSRTSWYSTL